jgi:chromosomal replication initiation ATPase DnaA
MYQAEKMADKVVDAFVDGSCQCYRVLYVYGSADVTEELVARVSRYYRRAHPEAKILWENGIGFHDKLIERVKAGYRPQPWNWEDWDLLIFENIHEVAGKEFSEELIYGLLSTMLLRGKQILVTGSEPVPSMQNLASRICAQLIGGLCIKT